MTEEELQKLREKIKEVTGKIISLAAERNRLAMEIGRIKKESGLQIEDEGAELVLERYVISLCKESGLDKRTGLKILHTLIEESKAVQSHTQSRQRITPMTMAAKARKLISEGRDVVRLDIGEPDFGPPKEVVDECIRALNLGKTKYTDTRGIPALISALQNYLESKYRYSTQSENLLVTPGGRFAIFAALSAIVSEGESVLIIEPCWPAYRENIDFVGARTISVRTKIEEGWSPDMKELQESITETTRAIIVSYPSNPTGKIIDRSIFRAIIEIAKDKKITVISDEIYNDYSYKDCPSVLDFDVENFILTSSFSKTWAMTGFRVGYAVSSREIIEKMYRVMALAVTCVPEFIQYGAIKALTSEQDARKNSETMKRRIEMAYSEISKIEKLETYKPDGAMYLFPVCRDENFDSDNFAETLLESKGVAVSPGTGFGDYSRAFRISLGQKEEKIVEGIKRIGEILS